MTKSDELFAKACEIIPGGVNSPVRAWKSVGGEPFFVKRGAGCHIYDVDNNAYIDYVGSWGPMILGHAHPRVMEMVQKAALDGFSFGAPTEREVTLAGMVVNAVPSIEMVRFVNSGTEATLSAIRLARAYTKCDKIIKMIGGYHGHHDALLASAGSGIATLGIPSTPGVPESVVKDTVLVPYNDTDAVRAAFEKYAGQIAAIIVEPVAGNMGVVPPKESYLQDLREITSRNNALLILDEVMTGFRVAYGGAQSLYGVTPDLTTLGKIIGGGMPIGAYGGKREIMRLIAPEGDVYQAGTLSGNPLATACGIATLTELQEKGFYDVLEFKAGRLHEGLADIAQRAGVPVQINRVGSMITLFFNENPVYDFTTASASDAKHFIQFWKKMLEDGIYLPPSAYEAWFVSAAHEEKSLDRTLQSAERAFKAMVV